MIDSTGVFDATDASSDAEWWTIMDSIGEDLGHFQQLGEDHGALFVDEGTTLLVTFESTEEIRARGGSQMPMGFEIARGKGWSHLCIIARSPDWYRDPAIWGYFDRLVDDAFFEDFDRVVFYGAGPAGYAAAAYSVAAPEARVLLVAPHATLRPDLAGWDGRYPQARRLDFTTRYGFAPDMTEGAGEVWLLHDPLRPLDAMHAALFARPHVHRLRLRHLGPQGNAELLRMGLLRPLIEAACEGELSESLIFGLWRRRRRMLTWFARLLSRTEATGRPQLTTIAARHALAVQDHPRLRRILARAEAELARTARPGA